MTIGFDLGGMSAKAACLNGGKLSGKAVIATSASSSAEKTVEALAKLCFKAAEEAGISYDEVEAIGVGAPGIVDSESGNVVSWANFGWRNVPLGESLSKLTGKPVYVLNDANAAALGETKFGAAGKYRDSILLTLGTGVGSGIVLGGKLFEGYKGAGAEVGHMVIRQGGRQCSCGRRGCLETYASTRALIAATSEEMKKHPESLLNQIAKEWGEGDGRNLFLALEAGDESAKRVFADYIAALGEGILNLVNLFRPQAILIGGGISEQGETLLAPLREYVRAGLHGSGEYAPLDVIAAQLKNDAGIYGAAEYARQRKSVLGR